MITEFRINATETEEIEKFIKCHKEVKYIFTDGSGIGITLHIQCRNCDAIKNVTDYNSW